jgi:Phospholipase_D-nuclease N-terminal
MRRRQFWDVVPQPVRIAACAIVCIAVLVGLVAGAVHGQALGHCALSPVLQSLAGIGMGLLAGSLIAIWILCLGYVYADSRRRAMPAILWTLLAALVPNLLGFLFYFALRRPLVSPCPRCGQPGETGRFCSACGFDKLSSASGGAPPQAV